MKFIVENWYLIVLALVSGALLAVPMLKGAAGGLTVANAVQLINREKAVLIDVCGADEYAAGHAGGSKSVPLGELEARLPSVVKNKAIPVVMVCASGGRATRAAAMARKLGYENAQVLAGGLKAWKDAGMPVEKS
ncbi:MULTISPECIES: rhodanese-like domain-containing protein [unclassified Simplicispira]|uniref:rhodanese-like domain-containing protein n=1 Tax=unclassified Simplicispira TaxID=2630407 RepID=UPI000D5EB141|nr:MULTISPECIES: rhodanese-like domain-containing protein [unclassified Simplicispira]MBH1978941.1 rhodanese-like domain-containing protein [Comamonadaceae bacterium]PVY56674.1 rhodanese-related sulfurtransferase [Simplicispira sp. 125]REG17618.1 rhodanese-related sulfurtransferase [Simplicispira sp. 110]